MCTELNRKIEATPKAANTAVFRASTLDLERSTEDMSRHNAATAAKFTAALLDAGRADFASPEDVGALVVELGREAIERRRQTFKDGSRAEDIDEHSKDLFGCNSRRDGNRLRSAGRPRFVFHDDAIDGNG